MHYHRQFSLSPKSLNKQQLQNKYLSIKLGVNSAINAYAYGKGFLNASLLNRVGGVCSVGAWVAWVKFWRWWRG